MLDLVCFCHLRWDFVYQRPQHLLSRFAKLSRVFFIEEPVFDDNHDNSLHITQKDENLWIVVPHLRHGMPFEEIENIQHGLLNDLFKERDIKRYMFLYYTPMAWGISSHLKPELIIYDCMDELSTFKFAPPELKPREKQLFEKADIVFTGGHNLFHAKKDLHSNIYPFPSSIDKEHFSKARQINNDPADQEAIPHPRFGFYGVVDERFDLELIGRVAEMKPEWHFIIIGPVVKIDPKILPRPANIHYLGSKSYSELPNYLAGWDLAIVPFVRNESTKYISPTKTPEYLAGGIPVISTSIVDVIRPYGDLGLVHIADTPEGFILAAEKELNNRDKSQWLEMVDEHLQNNSWDNTWNMMMNHISKKLNEPKHLINNLNQEAYV